MFDDEIDMSEADHVAWVRRKAITPSGTRRPRQRSLMAVTTT
jgi:hypothetical protein